MNSKYYLISKNLGIKFSEYKGSAIRLGRNMFPYTVDEVVIGIKNTHETKTITTFRDSKGNILERAFNNLDQHFKNRLYSKNNYEINGNEIVESKTVKQYSINRTLMNIYKNYQKKFNELDIPMTLWENDKVEINHIADNITNGEKILSKVVRDKNIASSVEKHSFVEYSPIINGKLRDKQSKSLFFDVEKTTKNVIPESITTNGVNPPTNDDFLGYRAMDIDSAKVHLSRKFLRERNLETLDDELKIKISTNYAPKIGEENLTAFCTPSNGSINFNKKYSFASKAKLAGTARHEVEHAWQYYLDARNTGGKNRGEWAEKIAKRYGEITNKKLKKEANYYTTSIDNYIPYSQNYKRYRQNYIEIKAFEEGLKTNKHYDRTGKEIRDAFKHIPEETL